MRLPDFFTLFFLLIVFDVESQYSIKGNFLLLQGEKVLLKGFNGLDVYNIDSTVVSENGVFKLHFTDKDTGMGYITSKDNRPFIVVLASDEGLELEGESLGIPQSIKIISGKQNLLFGQYAMEQPKREQALSAWDYLAKIYHSDSLFFIHDRPRKAIEEEKQRIYSEDKTFLASLDPKSYVSWYLPVRKLVSSVSTVAQFRTEDIPATISAFRNLDYADERLYKSGLLQQAIEGQYWLLENMGLPPDTVFKEMNISTDHLIENINHDDQKLNDISSYLFKLLERHNLFQASEYLALKVLNQHSCTLTDDLTMQLESYRAMKIGNLAPEIIFSGDIIINRMIENIPKSLSEISSPFKVIIFGASWCPECSAEIPQITSKYEKWKTAGVEVIFVSLDTEIKTFKNFVKTFPFFSICDYKKWETKSVKDYHIFATPTMFLLDNNNKILLRPASISEIDTWIEERK